MEKRLTWKQSIDGFEDIGLRPGVTAGEAICKLADLEEQKTIPLDEVYRVIAGHSNYHGDDILSALTCIAEGKEVKPVRLLGPALDAVEVVHGRWDLQRYYGGVRKGMVARVICSECGYPNEKNNYCPNCGAKMDGDGDV